MKKRAAALLALLGIVFAAAAAEPVRRGTVCFTFDDGLWDMWSEYALPLLKKYNARATFFAMGEITPQIVRHMQEFQRQGHSVGLHTVSHSRASDAFEAGRGAEYLAKEIMPQLEICRKNNINAASFAYPDNRHSPQTDAALAKYFRYMRAGTGVALGSMLMDNKDRVFLPKDAVTPGKCLGGTGIDHFYGRNDDDIEKALEYAAANDQTVVFFSHRISPDVQPEKRPAIVTTPARLERFLKKAQELNMNISGFDDLP